MPFEPDQADLQLGGPEQAAKLFDALAVVANCSRGGAVESFAAARRQLAAVAVDSSRQPGPFPARAVLKIGKNLVLSAELVLQAAPLPLPLLLHAALKRAKVGGVLMHDGVLLSSYKPFLMLRVTSGGCCVTDTDAGGVAGARIGHRQRWVLCWCEFKTKVQQLISRKFSTY